MDPARNTPDAIGCTGGRARGDESLTRQPVTAAEVADLVNEIKPILAGRRAEVQGAALADLLAIWLAGHVIFGDAEKTRKMRATLLAEHCAAVRQLTDLNAHIMGTAA